MIETRLDAPAELEPPGSGERQRALYVRSAPDDVFVQLDLPEPGSHSGLGVVVVPPFGWHEHCTYRVRRSWAKALADAGHTTARLDLPSTGDSAGAARDADRLESWASAVGNVARWLRQEQNCTRIVALGFGLGGIVAWEACHLGEPIDDLMLWGTPSRGRRALRELSAAAALNVDSAMGRRATVSAAIPVPPELDPADDELLVDEGGQVMTPETLGHLATLDLAALPLPDASHRRVLVFTRPNHRADDELTAAARATGADVAVGDGAGYDDMMTYVQMAVIPDRAISRSLAWLDAAPTGPEDAPAPTGLAADAPDSREAACELSSLELTTPSGRIRERPVELPVPQGVVHGMLCEPVDQPSAGFCAVFLNGGSDRRVGPNRMWVETARRWAERGVTSLRLDPPGIGESSGSECPGEGQEAHYHPDNVPRTADMLTAAATLDLPQRLILVGFCAGAHREVQIARHDERVAGLFLLQLPFFFMSRWTVFRRDHWFMELHEHTSDSPRKAAFRRRLRESRLMAGLVRLVGAVSRVAVRDRTDGIIGALARRGTETLLVFRADHKEYAELALRGRLATLDATPHARVVQLPNHDIRMRPLAMQRIVQRELDSALERLLNR